MRSVSVCSGNESLSILGCTILQHAMEEEVRAKTEQIQRKERYGAVSEMVQASPETKACSWVKANELKHLSKDLTEEIQELSSCIDQFLFTARSTPNGFEVTINAKKHCSWMYEQRRALVERPGVTLPTCGPRSRIITTIDPIGHAYY